MTPLEPGSVARPSDLSIDVPNLEVSLRFYREAFGFIEKARPFPAMAILEAPFVLVEGATSEFL
jgi:hypothetical protein